MQFLISLQKGFVLFLPQVLQWSQQGQSSQENNTSALLVSSQNAETQTLEMFP